MRRHIRRVVRRYRGQIDHWDVVNEAIDAGGNMRQNNLFWWSMGDGFVSRAFRDAHREDPAAKLAYNDFDIEHAGPKQDGVFELVESLLDDGVPVHEVGIQMHANPAEWASGAIDESDLRDAIRRFGSLGVDVYFTELDVRLDQIGGSLEQRLALQKVIYHAVASACHAEPACRGVTTWGFTDAHHYLPNAMAMPFDENYDPKPAFEGLHNGLMGLPVDTPRTTSCPLPGSVFCDPLESDTFPDLTKVHVAGGTLELTEDAYLGESAARAYTAPASQTRRAYVSQQLQDLGSQIWTRAYLYVPGSSARHFTAMAMDEPGAPWHGVSLGSATDGRAFIRVAGSPARRALGPQFPRNRWVCVEMRINVANSGGSAELFLDGQSRARVTNVDTQMSADYGTIKAGIIYAPSSGGAVEVRVDELASDPQTRLAELNSQIEALLEERKAILAAELEDAQSRIEEIQSLLGGSSAAPAKARGAGKKKATGKRRGRPPGSGKKKGAAKKSTAKKGATKKASGGKRKRGSTAERVAPVKAVVQKAGKKGISAMQVAKTTGFPYVSVLGILNDTPDFKKVGEKKNRLYFIK